MRGGGGGRVRVRTIPPTYSPERFHHYSTDLFHRTVPPTAKYTVDYFPLFQRHQVVGQAYTGDSGIRGWKIKEPLLLAPIEKLETRFARNKTLQENDQLSPLTWTCRPLASSSVPRACASPPSRPSCQPARFYQPPPLPPSGVPPYLRRPKPRPE